MSGVFARDEVDFLQNAQRSQGNVFHVADGRADKVQRACAGSAAIPHYARRGFRLGHTGQVYTRAGRTLSIDTGEGPLTVCKSRSALSPRDCMHSLQPVVRAHH